MRDLLLLFGAITYNGLVGGVWRIEYNSIIHPRHIHPSGEIIRIPVEIQRLIREVFIEVVMNCKGESHDPPKQIQNGSL
jgi:hypothetical protein